MNASKVKRWSSLDECGQGEKVRPRSSGSRIVIFTLEFRGGKLTVSWLRDGFGCPRGVFWVVWIPQCMRLVFGGSLGWVHGQDEEVTLQTEVFAHH